MNITICGGGSLGHVCLGFLGSQPEVKVALLTHRPDAWSRTISVSDLNGKFFEAEIETISSRPEEVIPMADVVLFCLPGFAIKKELERIKPWLNKSTMLGSIVCSTGFFFFAHKVVEADAHLFGFQRVPFIARTTEYGHSANLLGYKTSLNIAVENCPDKEDFRHLIERLFATPTHLLGCFYEASLTNSNPILHTGRLYSMWRDWDGRPFDRCSLFYKEWTVEAAQCLIDMDADFMRLLQVLPMDATTVPSLLDYYESHDAESLCKKLASIPAFSTIKAPMVELPEGGWIPDFSSRYFTEDFPYGLYFIVKLARQYHVATPHIDKVYEWGLSMLPTVK